MIYRTLHTILVRTLILSAVLIFAILGSLSATTLLYQPTTNGELMNKHDITFHHKDNNPGYWDDKSVEGWNWQSSKGYMGRVLFQGELGTTLSVLTKDLFTPT